MDSTFLVHNNLEHSDQESIFNNRKIIKKKINQIKIFTSQKIMNINKNYHNKKTKSKTEMNISVI